jgi:hypothetical protein
MIIGATRSKTQLMVDDRIAKVSVEAYPRPHGPDSPDFDVYQNWVDWEDGGPMTADEKQAILDDLFASAREKGWTLELI